MYNTNKIALIIGRSIMLPINIILFIIFYIHAIVTGEEIELHRGENVK